MQTILQTPPGTSAKKLARSYEADRFCAVRAHPVAGVKKYYEARQHIADDNTPNDLNDHLPGLRFAGPQQCDDNLGDWAKT
jgi:hypothetical protein